MAFYERTAFDSFILYGDIIVLNELMYHILTPVMAFLLGHRFQYDLFPKLFTTTEPCGNTTTEKKGSTSDHQLGLRLSSTEVAQ